MAGFAHTPHPHRTPAYGAPHPPPYARDPDRQPATRRKPPPSIAHPRRIALVEIKPNAGYVAIGQVLCYAWAFNRAFNPLWYAHPVILTDLARPYTPAMCADYRIQLLNLGQMLVEPPPYPT